jgi:hypothetical protein
MSVGAVQLAAIMRGIGLFFGTWAVNAITTYFGIDMLIGGSLEAAGVSEERRIVFAVLSGLVVALSAFGIRAGGEGQYDTRRANTGNLNKGDVAVASEKWDVRPVGDVGPITVTGDVVATEGV